MKILLVGINAKYVHTSLAIRALAAYAENRDVKLKEYTINEQCSAIVADVYQEKPQVVCFSCYIWNIEFVKDIISDLKKVLPACKIVCGGSEVSFDSADFLMHNPDVDAVICGEGEKSFRALCENAFTFDNVKGVTYRTKDGRICENETQYPLCNMDELPFAYTKKDIEENRGKLIYYETSRGCPFGCSYCLSSTTHRVRFRSLEKVKKELLFFNEMKVPIVKLTDRTFNANPNRTEKILKFLIENKADTTFHFEVAADLLNEETLSILESAPKNLFQLEIGVQSTNPDTIHAIDRKTNFSKISAAVKRLMRCANIHIHLDLIAGLPHEDINRFEDSFNDVFALRPNMLQLGFLKLLKGTKIREEEERFHYQYTQRPPYEILSCDTLSYKDILTLKGIENVLEKYYNSGAFSYGLEYLLQNYASSFAFFRELSVFFKKHNYHSVGISRMMLYNILCEFAAEKKVSKAFFDYLKLDFLLHNKPHTPIWSLTSHNKVFHKKCFEYVTQHKADLFSQYSKMTVKEIVKNVHFEQFSYDITGNGKKHEHILMFDMKTNHLLGKAEEWQ